MTTNAKTGWLVQSKDGWCLLPEGAEPDERAMSDATLCGMFVVMRGGSKRGNEPTCSDCRAAMAKGVK